MRSHYRKLARLAKSSSVMISEFGFQLFIKTVISELRKNKLQVFAPIIDHNEPKISDEVAYLQWLNTHAITPANRIAMQKELTSFLTHPTFHVQIAVDDRNKAFLKDTLDSLADQVYDRFDFSIKGITSQLENSEEINSNLQDMVSSKLKDRYVKNTDPLKGNADFTVFLQAGSVLTPDSLYRIAQFLNKNQDADIIYSDEDYMTELRQRSHPFFKPSWSPDLFLSMDYISNFFAVRSSLLYLHKISEQYGSAQFYELLLRVSEKSGKIFHIPTILVSIRLDQGFASADDFKENALRAIKDCLERRKTKAAVSVSNLATGIPTFRVRYSLDSEPKVSIIIPTKDNKVLLERCISAIRNETTYKNYDITIIDNNSTKEETVSYLKSLPYQVIKYQEPFNFSTMNNLSVKSAGDYLLFMNDDVAPLESGWLEEMLSICQQKGVGAVGAKLVHIDKTIQHAGIAILNTGAGFHPFQNIDSRKPGYFGFINVIRNCSAVTGACLLIKKTVFEEIGLFDEAFDLYYGDTDLCLKTIVHGYRVVYTPYAVLLHQGSSTIKENSSAFFAVENHRHFIEKWPALQNGDPFYNPNLGWNYKIDTKSIENQT